MADLPLFHLGGSWWLCFDRHQWVLSVADNPPKTPQKGILSTAPARLRAVAFVATEKRILRRVLAEKGVQPTPEAQAALNALPNTFQAWLRQHEAASTSSNQPTNIGRAA